MPERLKSDTAVAEEITCILSDVDGVLTDGRIIYSGEGIETKQFHARDGLGIKVWMRCGFAFGLVTARSSVVVERRASELGIAHVSQGAEDKLPAVKEMIAAIGCKPHQVCYLGDDLPDLPVMRYVGLAVAPCDASTDARETAQWVLRSAGGAGAVRETVERLLRATNKWKQVLK
ncbi:3-deoxy-D-manno-octulosonate 8-phosphate phosphatase KdsC [Novipirellula aureliae]|uniref:3-deoxy-D-manno-octulosonate 8-phosphate phosphatase KdsC n=1 Tax=Novipirellula aureliae TaxID=2527966 RepID=A0A5C6DZZ0_9BACT|nr:HAD-IIIA family hydrolase [Novipirellula aureliae]TWU43003.1 3-deoxy-D-manno-octulosonate 8-phosphate phosphatase KdsC [Novipirellula aureliae]